MGEMGSEGQDEWAEVVGFEGEKRDQEGSRGEGKEREGGVGKGFFLGEVRSCGETRACRLGREWKWASQAELRRSLKLRSR